MLNEQRNKTFDKALTEAVRQLKELQEKYKYLVNFAEYCKTKSCCNVCECMACEATAVLRKVEEIKNA